MLVELTLLGGALAAGRSLWRRVRRPPPVIERPPIEAEVPGWIDSDVIVGSGALALAAAGALTRNGALGLVSAPLTVWSCRAQFGAAAQNLVDERRVSIAVVEASATVLGFVLGAPIISASSAVVHVFGARLAVREAARIRLADQRGQPAPAVAAEAWIVSHGTPIGMSADRVAAGDTVEVAAGRSVVVDGVVVGGLARVDTRRLDGRLGPRDIGPGEVISAGDRVLDGRAHIRADAVGERTRSQRLETARRRTPEALEGNSVRAARVGDLSARFTAATAVLTGIFSGPASVLAILTGNLFSVYRLIGPAGLEAQLRGLASAGVEVPDGRFFELLGAVDQLCVDLTTLMEPARLEFVDVFGGAGHRSGTCLGWAAAALRGADSPVGAAIADAIHGQGRQAPRATSCRRGPDGVFTAAVDGHAIAVGPAAMLAARGQRLDPDLARRRPVDMGWTSVSVAVDGQEAAVLRLQPALRPGAVAMLDGLRRRGIAPVLISGERADVAERWARRLGIGPCWSELDGRSRVPVIESLRAKGGAVGYLGSGPLDLPAMAAADVALALHPGHETARRAADVVLCGAPLSDLVGLFEAAHRHQRGQGQCIALMAGGTGALAFGTLVFGIGPIATLMLQGAAMAAGFVFTLPDGEPFMALPAIGGGDGVEATGGVSPAREAAVPA